MNSSNITSDYYGDYLDNDSFEYDVIENITTNTSLNSMKDDIIDNISNITTSVYSYTMPSFAGVEFEEINSDETNLPTWLIIIITAITTIIVMVLIALSVYGINKLLRKRRARKFIDKNIYNPVNTNANDIELISTTTVTNPCVMISSNIDEIRPLIPNQ